MDYALHGALFGLGIGLFLVVVEFLLLKRAANDRARKRKVRAELSDQEKRQLSGVLRFSALLPFVLAAAAWFIWS